MTATAERPKSKQFPGVVREDEVYTLGEIKSRLKLGNWAIRRAQRLGLKTCKIGLRKYVVGRDVIEYLQRIAK